MAINSNKGIIKVIYPPKTILTKAASISNENPAVKLSKTANNTRLAAINLFNTWISFIFPYNI